MTADEVATALRVTPEQVRRLARRGAFLGAYKRPTRLGGWVIPAASLRLYLARRSTEGQP